MHLIVLHIASCIYRIYRAWALGIPGQREIHRTTFVVLVCNVRLVESRASLRNCIKVHAK